MDDFNVDFKLEHYEEVEESFMFTAKSITNDFVCEKGLDRLAKDSINKPLIWRHEHPVIPDFATTHIYGNVIESHVEKGGIISTYKVYGHTADHLKVREVIKERYRLEEPIKISMRFRTYQTGGAVIHYDVIEHSLTPTPACKECEMIEFIHESDIMPDIKQEEARAEDLKKIEALEEDLTKKEKLLEDLQVKVSILEESISEKEEEVEEKGEEKKEVLDKLLELNEKFKGQEKVIDELKEARRMDKLQPLIDKAVKIDGELMRSIYESEAKKNPKAKEFLLERIKELDKPKIAPEVKNLSRSADENIVDEELEDDDTSKQRDADAFRNMPKEFKTWLKGDK